MSVLTRRLVIQGLVQGVFYRAWSVGEATRLGLRGWVRNRSDGSVEMLVHGAEADVTRMIDLCREGPPAARVDRIHVGQTDEPVPSGFEKRPTL